MEEETDEECIMESITIILLGLSLLMTLITGERIYCEIGEKNAEIQKTERTNEGSTVFQQRKNNNEEGRARD